MRQVDLNELRNLKIVHGDKASCNLGFFFLIPI